MAEILTWKNAGTYDTFRPIDNYFRPRVSLLVYIQSLATCSRCV